MVKSDYTIMTSPYERYVAVTGAGFDRRGVQVLRGRSIDWYFTGRRRNGVRDASGLGLFDSGTRTPLSDFWNQYGSSGTYAVEDERVHRMRVGMRMAARPKSGPARGIFGVDWRLGGLAPNLSHDVQVAFCPDATCTPSFQDWRVGVTIPSDLFRSGDPLWRGPGTYFFRARLRDTSTGAASDWSPERIITVTP